MIICAQNSTLFGSYIVGGSNKFHESDYCCKLHFITVSSLDFFIDMFLLSSKDSSLRPLEQASHLPDPSQRRAHQPLTTKIFCHLPYSESEETKKVENDPMKEE